MHDYPRQNLTFLDEDMANYWTPETKQPPLLPVGDPADGGGWRELIESLSIYAPHLRESFVFSDEWWKMHSDTPESHMFQHILIRGINDIRFIFNSAEGPLLRDFRKLVDLANRRAEGVWNDRDRSLVTRMQECSKITLPILQKAKWSVPHTCIPKKLLENLDVIFSQSYGTEGFLLIGRAEDKAYAIQEYYTSLILATTLSHHKHLKHRVLARLGKVHGYTSIPLLSKLSVSAMWEACRSNFYRRQLSLLYRWIQPFSESLHAENVGCDYVSSLERFLGSQEDVRIDVMVLFYSWLMAYAAEFNLITLLDKYVGPTPVVVELVRRQLLADSEEERVRKAITDHIKGNRLTECEYSVWLWYSGIDFRKESPGLPSIIQRSILQRAMFDLKLGQRIGKSIQASRYSEFREARHIIEAFFLEFSEAVRPVIPSKIWWDEVGRGNIFSSPCVTQQVKRDPGFVQVLEAWVNDSDQLQESLDFLERHTRIVNNPDRLSQRVFSEAVAVKVTKFMESSAQALDERRKRRFANEPTHLKQECEKLGLFKARLPRFSQLYFHGFNAEEIATRAGQLPTNDASQRGAEAYFRSGARLESKCGISGVWYHYLETNRALFGYTNSPPPTPQLAIPTPIPSPYPRLDPRHMPDVWKTVQWSEQHCGMRPAGHTLECVANAAEETLNSGTSESPMTQEPGNGRNAAVETVMTEGNSRAEVAAEDESAGEVYRLLGQVLYGASAETDWPVPPPIPEEVEWLYDFETVTKAIEASKPVEEQVQR